MQIDTCRVGIDLCRVRIGRYTQQVYIDISRVYIDVCRLCMTGSHIAYTCWQTYAEQAWQVDICRQTHAEQAQTFAEQTQQVDGSRETPLVQESLLQAKFSIFIFYVSKQICEIKLHQVSFCATVLNPQYQYSRCLHPMNCLLVLTLRLDSSHHPGGRRTQSIGVHSRSHLLICNALCPRT